VPKGIAWHLYLAHCGAVSGPRMCWGARKWNRQQGHKWQFCSKICFNSAVPGGVSRQDIKNKIKWSMDNKQWVRWRWLGKYSKR
jgi:hypothetical protein